jgi:dsRNA-specific ribonuclease
MLNKNAGRNVGSNKFFDKQYAIDFPFIKNLLSIYIPNVVGTSGIGRIKLELFEEAMTHSSYTSCQDNSSNYDIPTNNKTYERLEYLGDAVFHICITEYLLERFPDENEGFITKLRIRIERGDSLADLSKVIGLDRFIKYRNININDKILEDIFESFIGAFYINFGMHYCYNLIIKLVEQTKDFAELIAYDDNYKDILLRYFHQLKWSNPIYKTKKKENKEKNIFETIVKNIDGDLLGKGISSSKKKSEQIASENALINLGVIIDGEVDDEWIDKIENLPKNEKNKKKKKGAVSYYNENNKLIKKSDIVNILLVYNIEFPKSCRIKSNLWREALTHKSYLMRKNKDQELEPLPRGVVKPQIKSNERIRLLGDAIVHFVIGEYLYLKYRNCDEGFLTRLRCKLENRESLYLLSKVTTICDYMLISQNIEILHGRNNVNIMSSCFEGFIGALYKEIGLTTTKHFILEIFDKELNINEIVKNETNYKDIILQYFNKRGWGHPIYELVCETGPDHKKTFVMGILKDGLILETGIAHSKKKAEQIASENLYYKLSENDKMNKII